VTLTVSVIAICIWLFAANLAALLPSKDNHWSRAYFLIATGAPILVWVFFENGVLIGLVALAASASVLRWPLYFTWRWVLRLGSRLLNR
jgi:hypothetical protein